MTSELDWRRRWKVDLKASPWKPLEIDGNKYLYKARFTLNSYEILITDMTSMWFETLPENALKKRIQVTQLSLVWTEVFWFVKIHGHVYIIVR